MKKIIVFLYVVIFASSCASMKLQTLAERQFSAACAKVQNCKINEPEFTVRFQTQVAKNDETQKFFAQTLICGKPEIPFRKDEKSVCVALDSQEFENKNDLIERLDEFEFRNIVDSKESFIKELQSLNFKANEEL